MDTEIFTLSKEAKREYCATIVRIGEVKPVEGSDFLGQTLVNGFSIVVRKDDVHEGDIMFYCANESALNLDFLGANNLFEINECDRNANAKEVNQLIAEGKKDEAKRMVGFFGKRGRVRMIRLRGCPSMGFLFDMDCMATWCPQAADVNIEEMIGRDFDTVCGKLFIQAYVPFVQAKKSGRYHKLENKLKRFDRIIPGEFHFHYDTEQLNRCITRVNPDDEVTISVKLHGTSIVIGNILTRKPIYLSKVAKMISNDYVRYKLKKLGKTKARGYHEKMLRQREVERLNRLKRPTVAIAYDNVYSSRTVIKNQYITKGEHKDYYSSNIWGEYNKLLKPFIPEGMTIYGEICGYLTDDQRMVQKNYDYGCRVGQNFLMIYRIVTTSDDEHRTKREWTVREVHNWTKKMMMEHPALSTRLHPIDILYEGTLEKLYPQLDIRGHWHDDILEVMKSDKQHFGMEGNEPLCHTKVPREGIVLRINNDPVAEAFKLKCLKFLSKESELMDKGEVDMEMTDNFG